MKKTISVIMAAAMLASSAAAFSTFADDAEGTGVEEKPYSDYVLNCEDAPPTIDGVIDDAYLQSFRVKHEFNRNYNADDRGCWPSGIFEVTEVVDGKNVTNYEETAKLVEKYFNGDPAEATSYFLWKPGHLYVAIEVKDSTPSFVSDEEYEKGAGDTGNAGLFLIDGVMPKFTWPVWDTTFDCYVDAGSHCGYVRDSAWVDWAKWCHDYDGSPKPKGHDINKEDGLWAVNITDDGYVVEMDFPVAQQVAENIFRDYGEENGDTVGLIKYGLALCDSPTEFKYVLDWALWQEGIESRGFQSEDFIYLNDFGQYNTARIEVKFSTEKIEISEPEIIVGDVNNDGAVDTADLVRLMKYIAADGQGIEAINTDINGDGETNSADLIRLMKIIAAGDETETTEPAPENPETTAPETPEVPAPSDTTAPEPEAPETTAPETESVKTDA